MNGNRVRISRAPREQVVAALLVGSVVVLLGLASGLGIDSSAAPTTSSAQPVVSVVPTTPEPSTAAPTTVVTPPVAYIAVPTPAQPAPAQPVPAATTTSRSAPRPAPHTPQPSATSPSTPVPGPSTTSSTPPPVACPEGPLSSVVDLLRTTPATGLLGNLLNSLFSALRINSGLTGPCPTSTAQPLGTVEPR